jgi:hypothetical protein
MAMRRSGGFSGGFDRQQVENELFPSTFDAPEYKAPAPTPTLSGVTSTSSKAAAPTSGLAVNRVGTSPTVDTTGGFSSSPKPKAPAPYADPAPTAPQPKAPVVPKTFAAPTVPVPSPTRTTDGLFSNYLTPFASVDSPLLRPTAPTLLATPKQDSTYSALDNYSDFFKNTQGQSQVLAEAAKESKDFSGLKNVDINKLNQNVSKGLDEYSVKEVDNRIINYVKDNNIAPFIETEDGEKLFFTSGTDTSMPTIAAMGDAHQEDGRYISFGEVGTYSSKWVPNPSTAAEILNTPALNLAAMFVPGGTAVLSAVKGLSGMTLHASDWANIVTGGLEASGQLKAPTADMPKGQGFSVGGNSLSYNASKSLLKAAATGDPVDAFMGVYGNNLIEGAVNSSEAIQGAIDTLGMSPDAFASAASKTAAKLAKGEDLDDSLISGLATYIKEGGGIGTPNVGDGGMFEGIREAGRAFDDAVLQPVKELVETTAGGVIDGLQQIGGVVADAGRFVDKEVLQPTKGLIEDVAEDVVEVGSQINKDYVKPAIETIEDINEEYVEPIVKEVVETGSTANKVLVKPIIDTIETVGSEIDDELLQPIKDVVEEAASAAGDLGSEFDDAVLQPVKEFIEEVGGGIEDAAKAGGRVFDDYILQPLKDLLEGILGNINLSGLGGAGVAGGAGLALGGGESSNALAENSPFKFKTEIGLTDLGADIVPQQLDIADLTTSPFESEFAQPQRFII